MSRAVLNYRLLYERFKEQDRQRELFGNVQPMPEIEPTTLVETLQSASTPIVGTPAVETPAKADVEPVA